jgi:branched-chain amino acid transport system permease protein
MVLGVLETYGVALTAPTYQSILIYGVFIVVLLWRPQGLFGARARAR